MADSVHNNKRIVKNTAFMYFRMLLTLFVGLYTSRIILRELGVSDYGLYNVVGGIITIFTFLSGTLSSGSQRFLSFALGENNFEKQKNVFSTTIYLHAIFAIITVIIAEILGLYLLYNHMNIPDGRFEAAFWVFQFSVLTTMVSIMQSPVRASLIAHEDMGIFAYISILEAIMKLIIVYFISTTHFDKLIVYAFLLMLVQITSMLINCIYCFKHYTECSLKLKIDNKIFKEIAVFSGWNIFGCSSVSLQGQGLNILLNMFFGTIVNAARGIAFQINSMVMEFVNSFQNAVNPQIVKLYASGDIEEMKKLVIANSQFAAYLFLFIAIPCSAEIDYVLKIWLGQVPIYTSVFVRIILFQSLIQTMTRPVVMVVHAVGKMKMVNLTAGGALLSILPVSYLLMKLGCDPVTVFLVNLIPWFFETFFELYFENKYCGFPILAFYKEVYGRVLPLTLLMLIPPVLLHFSLPLDGFARFFIVGTVSVICSSAIILYFGIKKEIRLKLIDKVNIIINSKILKK